MHNSSVADIDRNMAAVIDNIARLRLRVGNAPSDAGLRIGVIEYLALLYTASHKDAVLERAQTTQYAT